MKTRNGRANHAFLAPFPDRAKNKTRDVDMFKARDLKAHRRLGWLGWNTDMLPKGDQKLRLGTVGWHGLVTVNRKGKKGRGRRAKPAEPRAWRIEQWALANKRRS